MTIKEFLKMKRIKQIEIAHASGATPAAINLFVNQWKPLPGKYLSKVSDFLGITVPELKANSIKIRREAL